MKQGLNNLRVEKACKGMRESTARATMCTCDPEMWRPQSTARVGRTNALAVANMESIVRAQPTTGCLRVNIAWCREEQREVLQYSRQEVDELTTNDPP